MLDVSAIRRQFPILEETIDGRPLIYLDTAATAQKPRGVLECVQKFYEADNANVHRGMHILAERSTVAYESARKTVHAFLNARHPEEIIFTKSCTEAINLVAISLSRGQSLAQGDVVVLSALEHHSNIVPWMQLQERKGIEIAWLECDKSGRIAPAHFKNILAKGRVKLLSITAQSNVLGVCPPLKELIDLAHEAGALVLVDAAQSVAHHQTDVQALDCDFLAFSGHKLYGPTGIGVLYGKKDLLQSMPPFLGGGSMIQEVRDDGFTPADLPQKFEAGTPPIAQAVGLASAISWLSQFSWEDIEAHERVLLEAALTMLRSIQGITILGPAFAKASAGRSGPTKDISGCISFTIDGVHPHDLTEILGRQGICLRAGHHCTQPLHRRLNITASTRLSVGIYNTVEEITALGEALPQAIQRLA